MHNDSYKHPLHQFDLIAGALNERGLIEGTARLISKSTASFMSEEIAQITLEGEFENGLFLSGTNTIRFHDGTVNILSGTFSIATERFIGTFIKTIHSTRLLRTGVFFWNGELFNSLPEPTYYKKQLFENDQLIEEQEGIFLNDLLHGENGKQTIYSVDLVNDEPTTTTETTTSCFREGVVVGKHKIVIETLSATHKIIKTHELNAPFKMMEPFHGTCNEISFCMVNGEWVWEFESTLSGNGLSTDGDTSIPLFNGKLILISICNAFSHGDLPSQDKVYQLEERNGSFENMQLVEGEITIYHTGSVNKSTKPTEDDLHSDGCLILRETGKFKNEKLIAGTRVRRADNNLYMHTMGDWDHTTNQFKGQLTQIHAENKVEYQGTFTCVSDAELRMLPTASHYTFKEYIHQSLIREEEGSFLDWKLEGLGSRTEYQTGPHESNKITTKGLFHTGVATTINMITSELITPSFLVNILYTFTSNDASLYTGKMVLQTKTPNLVMLKRARWSGTMRPRKEPGQFELIQGEAVITTYENGQATIEQLRRGDFEHPTQLHSLPSTKMPCQEETWRINGAERELISRATGTFVHGKLVRSFVPRPPPQARSAPLTATIQTNDLKATIDALLKDELIEKKRLRETKLFQKAEKERQADLMLRKEQEKKHEKQRLKAEEDQRLLNEKQQKKEIDASRSKQRNANRLTTADTTHVKSAPMDTIELDDIDEVFEPGSIAIPDTRPTPIPDWSALEIEPYVFSSPIETRTRNERTARMESTSNALDLPQTF